MTELLKEMEQAGFCVFGYREIQRIEGGVGPPSAFPVAILKVVRSTSPEILRIGQEGADATQQQKTQKEPSGDSTG